MTGDRPSDTGDSASREPGTGSAEPSRHGPGDVPPGWPFSEPGTSGWAAGGYPPPAGPYPPPPGGPYPPYPPPGYYAGYPLYPPQVAPTRTSGLAIASLVLGILWLYWLGSILALIFGYIAKGEIDRSGGAVGGRGLAIAGIVLGWVGVGILALILLVAILGAVAVSTTGR